MSPLFRVGNPGAEKVWRARIKKGIKILEQGYELFSSSRYVLSSGVAGGVRGGQSSVEICEGVGEILAG